MEEAKPTLRGQEAHTPGSYLILSKEAAFTVVACVAYKQEIILKFKMNTYHSVALASRKPWVTPRLQSDWKNTDPENKHVTSHISPIT